MKLLIYTHPFAPMIGGVETYIMLLAQGLTGRHDGEFVEVTVATQAAANGMDDSVFPFQVIRRPKALKLLRLVGKTDALHISSPAFLPMLFAWLLRKPAVVEHSSYQVACPNGLLFHGPTKSDCPGHFMAGNYRECLSCNWRISGKWQSLRMLLSTFPRRWLCSRMTVNVGPSRHVVHRVAMPRTKVIYHGVPRSIPVTERGGRRGLRDVCFAFVGRMIFEKGVAVLLGAAHLLASQGYEFRLALIGDGPVRSDLERMTDALGLRSRTIFTGFLQGLALQDALRDVTAAVMPSIWEDVAPVACVEHMMDGRLLIASDLGGLGELLGDSGLKFPAGNADALAGCLRRVLENPDLANRLGAKARARALELFSLERMVSEHAHLYFQIAARGPV